MPVLSLRVIIYGDIKVAAPLSVIIYEEETMSAFFTAGLHFPHFGCIFAMAKGAHACFLFLVPGPSPVRQLLKKIRFHLEVGCHPARMSF